MDYADQQPLGIAGLEDQPERTPVHPTVGGIQSWDGKVHKTAARIGITHIFQRISADHDLIDANHGGLRIVGIIDILAEIL